MLHSDMLTSNHFAKESEYPYNGKESSCKDWKTCSVGAYVRNQVNVTSGDRLSLYTAIAQQPVSVKVDISSFAFQFYGAGILDLGCNTYKATHFATAVGYGTETTSYFFFWTKDIKFLLIKNSMREGWSESEYVRVKSGAETGDGPSCAYRDAIYPTI